MLSQAVRRRPLHGRMRRPRPLRHHPRRRNPAQLRSRHPPLPRRQPRTSRRPRSASVPDRALRNDRTQRRTPTTPTNDPARLRIRPDCGHGTLTSTRRSRPLLRTRRASGAALRRSPAAQSHVLPAQVCEHVVHKTGLRPVRAEPISNRNPCMLMVPGTGFEPVRTFVQRGLSTAQTVRQVLRRPDRSDSCGIGVRTVR